MRRLQSYKKWFQSFRRLRTSVVLVVATLLFEFANAPIFILGQSSQIASAQPTPAVIQLAKLPTLTEAIQIEPAAPIVLQVATPPPAPVLAAGPVAPRPVPASDRVSIPSVGLSARFVTVGTTSGNAIDVHPSLVGWWNGSAQPGSSGAAFLDGHNPGIFSRLPSVGVGAQISVARATGEVFNYTVVHTEVVPLAGINMNAALSVYGGGGEGLNLMTCVGTFDRTTSTTDQRLIVYAVRS